MFRSFLTEFKAFAMRGNVVDLAVGVIIGAAFGKIVSSLVADVVTPPIGVLLGGVDFVDLGFELAAAEGDSPAVVLAYGKFLQSIFDFMIVAAALFFAIKVINRLQRKRVAEETPAEDPEPSDEAKLLCEIRDLLRERTITDALDEATDGG